MICSTCSVCSLVHITCAVWFISPLQFGSCNLCSLVDSIYNLCSLVHSICAVWFLLPVQFGSYHLCNMVPITCAVWFCNLVPVTCAVWFLSSGQYGSYHLGSMVTSPVQYGLYYLCHCKDQSPVGCVLVPANGQVWWCVSGAVWRGAAAGARRAEAIAGDDQEAQGGGTSTTGWTAPTRAGGKASKTRWAVTTGKSWSVLLLKCMFWNCQVLDSVVEVSWVLRNALHWIAQTGEGDLQPYGVELLGDSAKLVC